MNKLEVCNAALITPTQFINVVTDMFYAYYKKDLIKRQPAIFIQGQPGIGKSQSIIKIMENLEFKTNKKVNLKDIRLLLYSPIDLSGIPVADLENNQARWLKPEIFQLDSSSAVINILFLDELTAAPRNVQAAAFQIALDKKLGEHKLPENTFIIAAGNRLKDDSIVNEMPSALKNRFIHFEFEINHQEWLDWAEENDLNKEIIQFIKDNPEFLSTEDFYSDSNIIVTPRSWETLSNLLKTVGGSIKDNLYLAYSTIGQNITNFLLNNRDSSILEDVLSGNFSNNYSSLSLIQRSVDSIEANYLNFFEDETKMGNMINYLQEIPKDFVYRIIKLIFKNPPKSYDIKEMKNYNELINSLGKSFEDEE